MSEHLSARAKEIVERIKYATVGTATKAGEPWNAPVFVAYDSDYNVYWGSHREAQHSLNIRETGRAFLVIYDSTAPPGKGEGVYIQAAVAELENPAEIEAAHGLLWARHEVPYWKIEQVGAGSPVRLYRAKPEKVWVNGEGEVDGTYVDVRTEIRF